MTAETTTALEPIQEKPQEWRRLEALFDGRYEIIQKLGGGGQSHIYCARGTEIRRYYVIKHVEPGSIVDIEENFRILRRLEHPQIPHTYEMELIGEEAYLVQDYVPGVSLKKVAADHRRMKTRLDTETAVHWMLSACEPLAYLHSLTPAVIHCDIKPGNLCFRDTDGRICVMDFDISREMTGKGVRARAMSKAYASPEQKQMRRMDRRTDVYSLGAAFFHLTTGQLPGEHWFHWPLPPRFQDLLDHCMAPDPAARFQSVDELRHALLRLL